MKTHSLSIPPESDQATPRQTPAEAFSAVVEQVRRDAVRDSQTYLDETTVPHGGE